MERRICTYQHPQAYGLIRVPKRRADNTTEVPAPAGLFSLTHAGTRLTEERADELIESGLAEIEERNLRPWS